MQNVRQALVNLLVWLCDITSSSPVIVKSCWTQHRTILLLTTARFCQKPVACAGSLLKAISFSHQTTRYGRTRGHFSRAWS